MGSVAGGGGPCWGWPQGPGHERCAAPPRRAGSGRTDQTCFVSEDHRLHAIPQLELVEHVRDMGLHRGLSDVKARSNFGVAEAARHLTEDVELALSQRLELFGLPRLRLRPFGELLYQPAGHRRSQQRVT